MITSSLTCVAHAPNDVIIYLSCHGIGLKLIFFAHLQLGKVGEELHIREHK